MINTHCTYRKPCTDASVPTATYCCTTSKHTPRVLRKQAIDIAVRLNASVALDYNNYDFICVGGAFKCMWIQVYVQSVYELKYQNNNHMFDVWCGWFVCTCLSARIGCAKRIASKLKPVYCSFIITFLHVYTADKYYEQLTLTALIAVFTLITIHVCRAAAWISPLHSSPLTPR